MNEKYWSGFYKSDEITNQPSSFAEYVRPLIKGNAIELGCGNNRDLTFFKTTLPFEIVGIDKASGVDVEDYIKNGPCKFDYVYTRFFWHSITRQVQLMILRWTKAYLFIEARTTEDEKTVKIYDNHDRNYIYVPQLVQDLNDCGFEIIEMKEGKGMSIYKNEDPHLVRIIAKKVR